MAEVVGYHFRLFLSDKLLDHSSLAGSIGPEVLYNIICINFIEIEIPQKYHWFGSSDDDFNAAWREKRVEVRSKHTSISIIILSVSTDDESCTKSFLKRLCPV